MSKETNPGSTYHDFCPICGSILPLPKSKGNIQCQVCSFAIDRRDIHGTKTTYTIFFNGLQSQESQSEQEQSDDGPLVERECRQCGHNEMCYATLQLRSADEGQTVFYTCPKCGVLDEEPITLNSRGVFFSASNFASRAAI
ncbi:unnamed protein product, partial [Darwinula stevensoni]